MVFVGGTGGAGGNGLMGQGGRGGEGEGAQFTMESQQGKIIIHVKGHLKFNSPQRPEIVSRVFGGSHAFGTSHAPAKSTQTPAKFTQSNPNDATKARTSNTAGLLTPLKSPGLKRIAEEMISTESSDYDNSLQPETQPFIFQLFQWQRKLNHRSTSIHTNKRKEGGDTPRDAVNVRQERFPVGMRIGCEFEFLQYIDDDLSTVEVL
ncbi:hypothetical protein C8R43DRAFT_1137953 [Mycena crocata]|nr:hypothetical protein C8R43DRAFT_1137953 [Mycena crocata]